MSTDTNQVTEQATNKCKEDKSAKPQRDKNGRFTSSKQKPAAKPTLDDSTVKIRVVKEDKPLPPKDFAGKLEDIKERTAISFIQSVIAHKPKVVNIDNEKYYHRKIVEALVARSKKEKILRENSNKCWRDIFNQAKGVVEEYQKLETKVRKSRNRWKGLAIGLIIGHILVTILPWVCREVQKPNASPAATVQMQGQN